MSEQNQMSQEEIAQRFKKANAAGFINQMISGCGATADQAVELFKKSDAKAERLLQKRASIRNSIIAEVTGQVPGDTTNLPDNLKQAASS